MPTTYDDLVTAVRDLTAQRDRPVLVAIGGHGGAGKSTLAARLAKDLGDAAVVGTDRFHAAGAGLASAMWELHDWPALLDLLRRVREGETRLAYRVRTWDQRERDVDEPMLGVVIVEGIRLLNERTDGLFDLAVWLEMDPQTAAVRAVARNTEQGDDDAELDLWRTKWIPEGVAYERECRPAERADVVLPASVRGVDRG